MLMTAAHVAAPTPPTIAHAISVSSAEVTGKTVSLSALGNDAAGASKLVYDWTITSEPAGGSATFSANGTNAAQNTTLTFTKAGTYNVSVKIVDPSGLSVTNSHSISVTPTLTTIKISTSSGGAALSATSPLPVSGASQTLVAQGLDQFGNALAAQPTFRWSTSAAPSGAPAPSVSGSGASATFTFGKVGAYTVSVTGAASGVSITSKAALNVVAKPSSIAVSQVGGAAQITGTTAQFTVSQFLDQFQASITDSTHVTWTATSVPSGAAAPTFSTSGATTTVTFSSAGQYVLKVTETDALGNSLSASDTVTVAQTGTSIVVTPSATSVAASGADQIAARELDQFGHALSVQPSFAWTASAGTINSAGLLTAPASAGSDTITAKIGALSGATTISVTATSGGLQNAYLSQLVTSLDADGSISRNDMIQILDAVAAKGTVTASELSDLKAIVSNAALDLPSYVQQLASDVVNGNTANATYLGASLGNLAAGSSATQLTDLVDKWFLGTDLPTLTSSSYTYKTVSGSLFPTTPSHTQEYQGELGDCYFISSLGTIADKDPAAIEDMFINNGDGTYTVRFYAGTYGYTYNPSNGSYSDGFANGVGTAQYVTVNLSLATTSSGMLVYSDYGAAYNNVNNALWIPLAEKAYAEWNQTGAEGRDGTDSFNGIQGGWMATVDAQVLGHNATDYFMGTATQQQLITALSSGQAVTIGTINDEYGLYGSHAYAVTAYNASTNTFTLYNPWGFDQPGQLTWSQLAADCTGFVAVNTSGASPISGAVLKAGEIGYFSSQAPIATPSAGPASQAAPASQTSIVAMNYGTGGNGGTSTNGGSSRDSIATLNGSVDPTKYVASNSTGASTARPTNPSLRFADNASFASAADQSVALADLFYAKLGSASDASGSRGATRWVSA